MGQTELFILFPEYVEGDQAATAPYLRTIDLLSEEEMEAYIDRFRDLTEFLTHENYTGYCDMENIRAFSRPLEMAEECYPDKKRSLLAAIRGWENWREEAAEMLRLAVGESLGLPLFYYDKEHRKYIQFKNENTLVNSYHAFHVEDNEVRRTLPKRVLKKIELILS